MKIYAAGISSPLTGEKEMFKFLEKEGVTELRILIPYEKSLPNFKKFRWVRNYMRKNKSRRSK